MQPGPLNLPTIWRGSDWGPVILKWKDQNGNPIDLTGWQPRAHSLNIDLNAQISDPVNGVTTLSLSAAQTVTYILGVESWDWIWINANPSTPYRFPPFLSGKVQIKQSQTNGVNGGQPSP